MPPCIVAISCEYDELGLASFVMVVTMFCMVVGFNLFT